MNGQAENPNESKSALNVKAPILTEKNAQNVKRQN